MMFRPFTPAVCLAAIFFTASGTIAPAQDAETQKQVKSLEERNAKLEELVRQQAELIDGLNNRVAALEKSGTSPETDAAPPKSGGFNFGKINISGEGAVGFFHTGSKGVFPNAEFRVDEAKLFVEAPIWEDVYFYTELDLARREDTELDLSVGELYLDFESISKLWNQDRMLNLRIGRLNVPFGEEYMSRDAIDNPLISHSITDFWGVDEGIELYGALGKFSYVIAVQNGGWPMAQDFTKDKSVAGRIAYDPTPRWHFSVSAMRTGDLDANLDYLSELWIGGGWFLSIGGPGTTRFHANLIEGDVAYRWKNGHLKAFGGVACYDDNDPAQSNERTLYFYSIEAQQFLTKKFYAATRFGQILVEDGYPLPGHGDWNDYLFNLAPNGLAENLWRLSLGLGYQFSENLVVKVEYAIERGEQVTGESRDQEDLFAAHAAFKF